MAEITRAYRSVETKNTTLRCLVATNPGPKDDNSPKDFDLPWVVEETTIMRRKGKTDVYTLPFGFFDLQSSAERVAEVLNEAETSKRNAASR
jgi:hypothetical protein